MKLEEEIQEKKFRSERQKAVLNIYYTNGYLSSKFELQLHAFELTPPQYNILRILRGKKGNALCIGEIKSRMLDKNSDVSRMVERLRIKNLLERVICKSDRRQMDVKISTQGLALLSKIDLMEGKFDQIVSTITEEEALTLNFLLDKLRG